MTLRIEKGGKIIYEKWIAPKDWDEGASDYRDEGYYQDVDISMFSQWVHKKDRQCTVEEGVTIGDIYKIVSSQPELCELIFTNCFVSEFVAAYEKVKNTLAPERKYDPDAVEYAELYWVPEYESDWNDENGFSPKNGRIMNGLDRACFHGVGYELQEDKYETYDKENPSYKKGERVSWGIDFMPFEELIHIPLKLNTKFVVKDDWHSYERTHWKDIPTLIEAKREFTLQQIIEGVLWELSFYGTPDDAQKKKEELNKAVEDLDLKNKSVDDLIKEGKVREVNLHMKEELNDGYVNDGMGWKSE